MDSSSSPAISDAAIVMTIEPIYRVYAAIANTTQFDADLGLGGKLLFAGEIGSGSRDLLYAANIAGAASLAASDNPAVQRQAIRDGVVDFSVNSLEEALRILKNEIRKRQPVSVGVAVDTERLVEQMLDRGVLPDILPSSAPDSPFIAQGARLIAGSDRRSGEFVTWSVDREFNRWLTKLDGCAQAVIPADDCSRQRWLRLAPRYLGRGAQRLRGMVLGIEEMIRFRTAAEEMMSEDSEAPRLEIRGGIVS